MQVISLEESLKKGSAGERVFITDFLEFLNVKYENVTGQQAFQIMGTDFIFPLGKVDIKNSYKSYEHTIILEEYTNHSIKKPGWFDTSQAHLFVFVDVSTRHMVFVPNSFELHNWYGGHKDQFKLCMNKISYSKNGSWQSSFRVVDLNYIPHSFYYKGYIKADAPGINHNTPIQLILEDCFKRRKCP